jgi:hypothetical protein
MKFEVTLNSNEPTIYENNADVALVFKKSWPAKTLGDWQRELIECHQRGWTLVNTGTDGNRIQAKPIK